MLSLHDVGALPTVRGDWHEVAAGWVVVVALIAGLGLACGGLA
jgi:hypothetical protein